MRVWVAGLFIVACTGIIGGGTARAGGIEYAGAGTQALGRGGAVAARADDPMVLMYNPAGLVELRGMQLMINANLPLMKACVDPIGYYGWGVYGGGRPSRFTDAKGNTTDLMLGRTSTVGPAEQAFYDGAYDTVCMDQGLTPVPQLGMTARLSNRFGIGIGMMFPNVTPQGTWGSNDGVIQGAAGLRPAATRYMMTNSGTLGIFPTIGLAYKIAEWLRIGASFRMGVINVDNTSVVAVQVGTTPANDLLVHLRATDWFVPELTTSIHIIPTDAIDFVGGFHYQGDLDAPGSIDFTSGLYDPASIPHHTVDKVTSVHQQFPWSTWGALRFASRLAPRPTGDGHDDLKVTKGRTVHDAFQDERFDVELDVHYEMNARNRELTVAGAQTQPGQVVEFQSISGTVSTVPYPDVSMPVSAIQKRWKNQISARLGGAYNIVPGVFGISAGVHYENRGVDPSYMQIDYWPLERIGLHAGVRFRIANSIDLMFAYAHIFQETLVVSAPPHADLDTIKTQFAATNTVTAVDKRTGPNGAQMVREEVKPAGTPAGEARLGQNFAKALPGTPPVIINAGTYRSGIDVLSAGVNMHF